MCLSLQNCFSIFFHFQWIFSICPQTDYNAEAGQTAEHWFCWLMRLWSDRCWDQRLRHHEGDHTVRPQWCHQITNSQNEHLLPKWSKALLPEGDSSFAQPQAAPEWVTPQNKCGWGHKLRFYSRYWFQQQIACRKTVCSLKGWQYGECLFPLPWKERINPSPE